MSDEQKVIGPSSREHAARAEIVRDIIRAKKALGIHGKAREKSFFKEIWPDILRHLKETGYKLPE